jgi:hypothetical protein
MLALFADDGSFIVVGEDSAMHEEKHIVKLDQTRCCLLPPVSFADLTIGIILSDGS